MAEWSPISSISDFCLLVQDLERAIEFYRDRVGFKLRRLAPGFADFFTARRHPGPVAGGPYADPSAAAAGTGHEGRLAHHGGHPGGKQRAGARDASGARCPGCSVLGRTAGLSRGTPMPATSPTRKTILWEIYTWQEGGHANLIFSGEP